GGDCLCRFFRRTDRDADLWRCCVRPKRLPALQGAPSDLRQKMGREYHCFFSSTRHPGRRAIGGQWGIRRLTEEPGTDLSGGSTKTSWRVFRIIGRAANRSRPAAIAIKVAEI